MQCGRAPPEILGISAGQASLTELRWGKPRSGATVAGFGISENFLYRLDSSWLCQDAVRSGLLDRCGFPPKIKPALAGERVSRRRSLLLRFWGISPGQASLTALQWGKPKIMAFVTNLLGFVSDFTFFACF